MDLSDTIVPKSDQLNAEHLLSGPRTFTVTEVRKTGGDEQPVSVHLAEMPGKPFKPSKTVRRILIMAWGKEGDAWAGRRLTLYRDEDVKWAGQAVGGIRVSHLSHIDRPLKLALTETKGKRTTHTIEPLRDAPAPKPADDPLKALADAMTKTLELATREDKLAYLSGALGREIASAKDVTPAEATRLLQEIAREQQTPSPVAAESTVNSSDADASWPAVATIPGTEADQ